MRTFCFCTTEFGDSSGGEVFNIPISLWYFVHDYTTNTTPTNPAPRPNSFASADDISKEVLAPYKAWWEVGGWGEAYLDETGPQSGHGPKGQSPIHFKVVGCVCMFVC